MGFDYTTILSLLILFVDDLLLWALVFFINGCSANSCDLGVPMRGGDLRVFLLHYLAQSPQLL